MTYNDIIRGCISDPESGDIIVNLLSPSVADIHCNI